MKTINKQHYLIFFVLLVSVVMIAQVVFYDDSIQIPLDELEKKEAVSLRVDYPDPELPLEQYKGKVVLVNFWATWCPSCDKEMPSIESLQNKFSEDELVVLTVSIDEKQETIDEYMATNGFTFPVIYDPNNTLGEKMGVSAYPETHILNKEGVTIQKVLGAKEWDSPEYLEAFRQLIHDLPIAQNS